ncbi:MAG: hypothetical protein KJ850_07235 [Gammaproteobacteria bacterium]|nr:hypothetical protein [Gammaproteobacteria bacterium]MBU1624827.1 hypothetical protein [Gammaproteobacteria bacterium]MBU1982671.1 hypothetical protein [Gammaproteobacteria bacterium]
MNITSYTARTPQLVQALEALGQRADNQQAASILFDELCGINVLVAKKFTNDRTAEGIHDAFHLTVGCISLAISQADIADTNEAKLSFLLQHGAEYVFQMGFRHMKELSALPYTAYVSDFDNDPFVQQRNLKAIFMEICSADPASSWSGDAIFQNEMADRKRNQQYIDCGKWLRKHNAGGVVRDSEMDASAAMTVAVLFALYGDGRIVARTAQRPLENLIAHIRDTKPDVDASWNTFLKKIPPEFQPLLRERMEQLRDTIVKKLYGKTKAKTLLTTLQDQYIGSEQDIDYA